MIAITCSICGEIFHTASPKYAVKCPYCGSIIKDCKEEDFRREIDFINKLIYATMPPEVMMTLRRKHDI